MFDSNFPDLSKLPEDERRQFVRKMLTDESVRSKCILMAGNDGGGQAIDLDGLMKTVGPQKVEDMLVEVLGRSQTQSAVMSDDDVIQLMERCENGTATPVEIQMANFIAQTIHTEHGLSETAQSQATTLMAHTILDIIHFVKEKTGYDMEYLDVLTAVVTLMIASTSLNDQNGMYRFKDSGPAQVLPMLTNMAEDIAKRLEDSFGGKKPPDDILLLGLLTYAEKLSANFANGQHKWGNPQNLADFFGMEHSFTEASEAAHDSSKGENGSNGGNVCQPDCYTPNEGEPKND